MALNILSAFGALGRLLPGYVQGQRQAVQDNWNDLNQYNQAQAGQMQNAWDEAMFNPKLSMGYDAAALSRMGLYNTGMDLNVRRTAYPGALQSAAVGSMMYPAVYANMLRGQLGQGQALGSYFYNPASTGYWGNTGTPMAPQLPGMPSSVNPAANYYSQLAAMLGVQPPQQMVNPWGMAGAAPGRATALNIPTAAQF